MNELLYRVRQKSTGLFMHGNSLSWSERGTYLKSLEEARNQCFWSKLDSNKYDIVEYTLNEEKIYEISNTIA